VGTCSSRHALSGWHALRKSLNFVSNEAGGAQAKRLAAPWPRRPFRSGSPRPAKIVKPVLIRPLEPPVYLGVPNPHRHSQEAVLKRALLSFFSDESGATAIEYGLIAAGIALAIIAAVNGLGTNLNTQFTSINSSLK